MNRNNVENIVGADVDIPGLDGFEVIWRDLSQRESTQATQPTQATLPPMDTPTSADTPISAHEPFLVDGDLARIDTEPNPCLSIVRMDTFDFERPALTFTSDAAIFNRKAVEVLDGASFVNVSWDMAHEKIIVRTGEEDDSTATPLIDRCELCKLFPARFFEFMGWNTRYSYTVYGSIAFMRGGSPTLVFDLRMCVLS